MFKQKNFGSLSCILFINALVVVNTAMISVAESRIDISKVSIGGVYLSTNSKGIISKIGKPHSVSSPPEGCIGYPNYWNYDGITIRRSSDVRHINRGFDRVLATEGDIYDIETTDSRYPTNKGIKVGDSITKAARVYSKHAEKSKDGFQLVLEGSNGPGGLLFYAGKNGKIKKIELLYDVCY